MELGFVLFGLVFGAAVGVLTTDATLSELRTEAARAFGRDRWRKFVDATSRPLPFRILWAITHLLRIEAILLLAVGLFVSSGLVLLLGTVTATGPLSSLSHVLLGAMIGFAAAPWVWLHFSRDLKKASTDTEPSTLDRYKFVTVVLAVLLVATVLVPFLPSWLGRVNKVDVLGIISLGVTDRPTRTTGTVYSLSGEAVSGNGSANDQLSSNTDLAQRIANPNADQKLIPKLAGLSTESQLAAVKADLQGFDALSVIDRDRAFIAFLSNEWRTDLPTFKELRSYIDMAERNLEFAHEVEADLRFTRAVSPLFRCLGIYAKRLSDYHLFMIDTSPTIKAYLESIHNATSTPDIGSRHLEASGSAITTPPPGPTTGSGAIRANPLQRLQVDAMILMTSIQEALGYLNDDTTSQADEAACQIALDLTKEPMPSGMTPYPTLIAAYTFAAVNSAETGVVLVSNWLRNTVGVEPGRDSDVRRSWYQVRAMLNLGQIASGSRNVPASKEAIVRFQRLTTDEMGEVLGVTTPIFWRRLCEMLQPNTLHAGVGRRLAFAYATARNTLFEFLEPDLSSGVQDSGDETLKVRAPLDELEEARTILDSAPRCFERVPLFEQNRPQFMGEFRLNVAQLRVNVLPTIPPADRGAEIQAIRGEIDRAERLLGLPKSTSQSTAADLLLKADPFQGDRDRLRRLRATLAAISTSL